MKIAVITLHYVTNFGSLLQTYATQSVLEKLGHEVQIIDFRPVGLSFRRAVFPCHTSLANKLIKLPFRFLCNLVQFHMVEEFIKHNINLSDTTFHTYNELVSSYPKADCYISGSDQVWNTQNSNRVEDIGAYYLRFVDDCPKIAYAGSFGKLELSSVEKKQIKQWLMKYSSISVREDSAVQILEDLGINAKHVADPTLLLSAAQWMSFCKKGIPNGGYVLVYNLNRNKVLNNAALKLANAKRLKIVNFADTFEFIKGADNRLINDPHDFLRYIAAADYVLTDSFHGTAFSLIFAKQVICVSPPKYSTRLNSLLAKVGCNDRMAESVEEVLAISQNDIDYSSVREKIDDYVSESENFLREALRVANEKCFNN